jgi:RNA polymerase sigma factor (TIGR02999 family)
MTGPEPRTVTRLLLEWRQGDDDALHRLMPLVYDELRRIAGRLMGGERGDHTLQATALVHEAYARMVEADLPAADRSHFLSLSAQVMRRILIDHARARKRSKRGGGALRVTLAEADAITPGSADRLIEIDDALERLRSLDPRKHRALEMSVFGGMTHAEIGAVLEVSIPTVERDLRMARAWLRGELRDGGAP